eukprot:jgi/Bigna1/69587/fgenesh1_pg.9_\
MIPSLVRVRHENENGLPGKQVVEWPALKLKAGQSKRKKNKVLEKLEQGDNFWLLVWYDHKTEEDNSIGNQATYDVKIFIDKSMKDVVDLHEQTMASLADFKKYLKKEEETQARRKAHFNAARGQDGEHLSRDVKDVHRFLDALTVHEYGEMENVAKWIQACFVPRSREKTECHFDVGDEVLVLSQADEGGKAEWVRGRIFQSTSSNTHCVKVWKRENEMTNEEIDDDDDGGDEKGGENVKYEEKLAGDEEEEEEEDMPRDHSKADKKHRRCENSSRRNVPGVGGRRSPPPPRPKRRSTDILSIGILSKDGEDDGSSSNEKDLEEDDGRRRRRRRRRRRPFEIFHDVLAHPAFMRHANTKDVMILRSKGLQFERKMLKEEGLLRPMSYYWKRMWHDHFESIAQTYDDSPEIELEQYTDDLSQIPRLAPKYNAAFEKHVENRMCFLRMGEQRYQAIYNTATFELKRRIWAVCGKDAVLPPDITGKTAMHGHLALLEEPFLLLFHSESGGEKQRYGFTLKDKLKIEHILKAHLST